MSEASSDFPADILDLPSLTPKRLKLLQQELGIGSLDMLKVACESGKLEALAEFGAKDVEVILGRIDEFERSSGRFRRSEVLPVAERILKTLRRHSDVIHAEVAGPYRREWETFNDLHILVATKRPAVLTEFFIEIEEIQRVILQGSSKAAVLLKNGLPCDLRTVSPAEWPFALLHFTGSKGHNLELCSRALKQGFNLNEYHLALLNGETWNDSTATIEEEADIYKELGLPYIEPKLRENRGEFEAAENNENLRAS